jgi:hypothetical protein
MKFDELCNELMVENTDSFDSMKEDEDKLDELYYKNPKKYEELEKKLFNKYFSRFDEYSDWEKLKNIMKEKGLYMLKGVSQRYNNKYKKMFDDLYRKMQKEEEDGTLESNGDSESLANMISTAWAGGLDNAGDTYRGDDEHPNYWNLAYKSICQTSPFDESEDVRDWYKANGYTC